MKQFTSYSQKFLLIIIGVCISKLLLAGFFSSGYQNDSFLVVTQHFISTWTDPWEFFDRHNINVTFNYPPLMLAWLAPGAWLIDVLSITNIVAKNVLFKFPLLIADVLIFIYLMKLLPNQKTLIFYLYFLSPIVLLSTYIFSFIDLIPTAIFFLAVFYLLKNKYEKSAVLYALALLTKTHLLVALPLIIIFIYKKHAYRDLCYYLAISTCLFSLGCLPFISTSFIGAIFASPEQNLLYNTFYKIGELKLYLIPLLLSFLYVQLFYQQKVNHDLFLGYLTLCFVVLILFTHPMPSWYLWVMPYLYIFIINYWRAEKKKILLLLIGLNVAYVSYFLFFYTNPVRDFEDLFFLFERIGVGYYASIERWNNLVFTFLEASVLCIAYFIYASAVKSNSVYSSKNLLIGVAGDSSAGKTTLRQNLIDLLGHDHVTSIEGDGEHKWERGNDNWNSLTHLDPKANKLYFQSDYLNDLKQNKTVRRRDYDHSSGNFTQTTVIYPKSFIILSGLHSFYLPRARKLLDIKIFLDTEMELIKHWKLIRDTIHRGHTAHKVLDSLNHRQIDREKYILPQKEFADVYFKIYSKSEITLGNPEEKLNLALQVKLSADLDLEPLLTELSKVDNFSFSHDFIDDASYQQLELSDDIKAEIFNDVAGKVIPNIHDITTTDILWQSGISGLQQMFMLVVISYSLRTKHV